MRKKLLLTLFLAISSGISHCQEQKRDQRSNYNRDPCLDIDEIKNLENFNFPKKFENIQRPWIRDDGFTPKVYQGDAISYQWGWMKSLEVKGLGKSIEDVLQFLNEKDCLFLATGQFVKNVLLKVQPHTLTGEVSCNISKLYNDCRKKFGGSSCSLFPIEEGGWGEYHLEIGDSSVNTSADELRAEPIKLYEWRSEIGKKPEKWGYTVDTMAIYDDGIGSLYLIDVSGRGYRDTCDKKLVATVEKKDWNVWSKQQMHKILGFYDLRVNGFSVTNSEFQAFVNEKIKNVNKKEAQTFYCENILKGVVNIGGGTSVCHTMYPKKEMGDRIKRMREIMIREIGPNWNDTIGTAGEELEAIFCTNKQFVGVRNRLKHRIQSSDFSDDVKIEPKKIIEGKPMIKDVAEVHKRPIFAMNEEQIELPAEFPSLPNAKPNEKLEFEEVQPEIGGYNDPIAYVASNEKDEEEEEEKGKAETGVILSADDVTREEIEAATKAAESASAKGQTDNEEEEPDIVDMEAEAMANAQLKDYETVEVNGSSRIMLYSSILVAAIARFLI